jgi:Flp pilus assembly CpaF family ATPase
MRGAVRTVRLQADLTAITTHDLLRASLRHRPDRILVGAARGGEAFDLLQVLNTGRAGTFATIHANAAEQAVSVHLMRTPVRCRRAISGHPSRPRGVRSSC